MKRTIGVSVTLRPDQVEFIRGKNCFGRELSRWIRGAIDQRIKAEVKKAREIREHSTNEDSSSSDDDTGGNSSSDS